MKSVGKCLGLCVVAFVMGCLFARLYDKAYDYRLYNRVLSGCYSDLALPYANELSSYAATNGGVLPERVDSVDARECDAVWQWNPYPFGKSTEALHGQALAWCVPEESSDYGALVFVDSDGKVVAKVLTIHELINVLGSSYPPK